MIPIIRVTTAAEIPNGMGSENATRKSCTVAMLADAP
jgi:hypothetical protein